jgi:hypothetical protein
MIRKWLSSFEKWLGRWMAVVALGSLENASSFSMLSGMWRGFHNTLFKKNDPKKMFFLGAVLLAWALAGNALAQLNDDQKWIEQADAGAVFPVSPVASSNYAVGYGGDLAVGYRFDRTVSLATSLGYYNMNLVGAASSQPGGWIYVPLMEILRVNFGDGWVRPYVLLGLGASFNNFSIMLPQQPGKNSDLQTSFIAAPGLGVLFVIFRDMAFYVQSRLDLNFVNGGAALPSADSPSVFIPVKAGLSFFVL